MRTSEKIKMARPMSVIVPSKKLKVGEHVYYEKRSLAIASRFCNVAEGRVLDVVDGEGHAFCMGSKIQETDLIIIEGNEEAGPTSDAQVKRGHLPVDCLERLERISPDMLERMGYVKQSNGEYENPRKEQTQFYQSAFEYIDFVGAGGVNTEIVNDGLNEYNKLRETKIDFETARERGFKKIKESLDNYSWLE